MATKGLILIQQAKIQAQILRARAQILNLGVINKEVINKVVIKARVQAMTH